MRPRLSRLAICVTSIALAGGGLAAVVANNSHLGARSASSNTEATGSVTPTASSATPITGTILPAAVPPLTSVTYHLESWGDPVWESGLLVSVPKSWTKVKLRTYEAKFTSPNKLWVLRVDGTNEGSPISLKKATDTKVVSLRSVPGLKIIARVDGTTRCKSAYCDNQTYRHTTLTYLYTDAAQGTRLVINRFVAADGNDSTSFEVIAAGRPQDRPGLEAIATTATADNVRLP